MKSAADPVTSVLRLAELAAFLGFIVLLAVLAQAVTTVGWRRAVRRSALSDALGRRVVGKSFPVLEEFGVRLLALLPLGVKLLALLDVSVVVGHVSSLDAKAVRQGESHAKMATTAKATKIPRL